MNQRVGRRMQGRTTQEQQPAVTQEVTQDSVLLSLEAIAQKAIPIEADFCGVYFLFLDRDIIYIGQSARVRNRVDDHYARGCIAFDRWTFIECPREDLRLAERAYIDKYMPRENRDSTTEYHRGNRAAAIHHVVLHPLEGIPQETLDWIDREHEDWVASQRYDFQWSEEAAAKERLRRARAIQKNPQLKPADFGLMPRVGDDLPDA
jgi:hypothetical protein